jgi:large subunit ribosomal protein L13
MSTETHTTHTIDATGKRLGKVATEAAQVLLGKNDPTYTRHTMANVKIEIRNASKLDIPEGKHTEIYQSFSGYPGGRKTETLIHLAERLGYGEVLKRTIGGMLPNNKHKKPLLNNVTITE